MSDDELLPEKIEFEDQLRYLSAEAQVQIEERAIRKAFPSMLKALRPLVLGIEALSRATEENTGVLYKLQKAATDQTGLSDLMSNVQEKIDQKQAINQQLFDALHSELKGYKDGFLLEVLQKPIIRDLINLFDDLSAVERQLAHFSEASDGGAAHGEQFPQLQIIGTNLTHTRDSLIEILERMEVVRQPLSHGKLDKHKQRAVSLAPADSADEDLDIVASLKPGFKWRDRILRPEEVIIKKWKEGYLMEFSPQDSEPSKEPATTS